MKIISLNIWGGTCGKDLLDFFVAHTDVDVFVLQEVLHNATQKTIARDVARANIYNEIQEVLPNHIGIFASAESGEWGLASFVKKDLHILEHGDVFVYRNRDALIEREWQTFGKNLQYLKIEDKGRIVNILNFHGLWNGKGKTDTEERLSQSDKIIRFVKTLEGKIILMGDFNLRPDTESLKNIEKDLELENLITRYKIKSTRTTLYDKDEKYADYTLVSSDVVVNDFKILPEEVSDHAAMFIEI